MNSLWDILSDEIQDLIRKHAACILIQETFIKNRNISEIKIGDRVLYQKSNKKYYYGTIDNVRHKFSNGRETQYKYKISTLPNINNQYIDYLLNHIPRNYLFLYRYPQTINLRYNLYKSRKLYYYDNSPYFMHNGMKIDSYPDKIIKIIKLRDWKFNFKFIDPRYRIYKYIIREPFLSILLKKNHSILNDLSFFNNIDNKLKLVTYYLQPTFNILY
jgi:hypothetical protein